MPGIAVDTHSFIWFVLGSPKLSAHALARLRTTIDQGALVYVPTVCLVELTYLVEKGRLPSVVQERTNAHLDDPSSGLALAPLNRAVADAIRRVPRQLVPDMPDRIIGATALSLGIPLVTRDQLINVSGLEAIW